MSNELELAQAGAQRIAAALGHDAVARLRDALSANGVARPGMRLTNVGVVQTVLSADGPIGAHMQRIMGATARPVRAVLFDKNETMNWALGWHQDRTIVVRERIEVPGFGPWTIKQGLLHVAPPPEIQRDMRTVRLHLDDVDTDNAPLLIAPGSHRLGRIAERDVAAIVARCGTAACLAETGDAWVYATPILHASEAARRPRRRRVLQADYAASDLPGGLQWLGV